MRHKNLYSVEVCITMDNSGFIKREKTRILALGYNEDDAAKQVQEQLRLSFDVMRHNVELKHDFSHLDNETETVIPKTER